MEQNDAVSRNEETAIITINDVNDTSTRKEESHDRCEHGDGDKNRKRKSRDRLVLPCISLMK